MGGKPDGKHHSTKKNGAIRRQAAVTAELGDRLSRILKAATAGVGRGNER